MYPTSTACTVAALDKSDKIFLVQWGKILFMINLEEIIPWLGYDQTQVYPPWYRVKQVKESLGL